MQIKNIFAKFFKGEQGESYVCESIASILKDNNEKENYYLIPKAKFESAGQIFEIDLLLLHPVLGIYVIEVKNWDSLEMLSKSQPYTQATNYKNIILSLLKEEFDDYPINVEMRVIFPRIQRDIALEFFKRHPYEANMQSITFFKEDLVSKNCFTHFFKSSTTNVPNKKEFLKITSLLVPKKQIEQNQVIPIITKDEVLFFDHKQLGIMNGYNDGFRIIRGVAGTGKTIILTNFVSQRLAKDPSETFLILCFNNNLENDIKNSFETDYKESQIRIISILSFLKAIKFNHSKIGITQETKLPEMYELFETDIALTEFKFRLKAYLKENPVDYMLCDETQDMPEGFMRILYEEIHDCIFFIDEAQRFYSYSMQNIAQVFHHPKFEKLKMQGRVKNLKNVYRTPSNIAMCAFEILNLDKSLNEYYQKSFYLKSNFTKDINCILESGKITIDDFDFTKNNNLESLLKTMPKDSSSVVLTFSNKHKENIAKILQKIQREDIKAMTIQGVKGLEAQNVIVHGLVAFLKIADQYEKELLFRKAYVLLTRARENLYLDFSGNAASKEVQQILEIIKKYANSQNQSNTQCETIKKIEDKNNALKLAKIQPVLSSIKESSELIVAGSELFALVAGLFAF